MNKQKTTVLSALVAVLFVAVLYLLYSKVAPNPEIGCTLDAKICPDGSAVGRFGPKCEFDACPQVASPTSPPSSDMNLYSNTELGFSFSYPSGLGEPTDLIENGQTGKKFYGSIGSAKIGFGGISIDYSQGRSGMFSDFSGYTNKNGTILYKAVQMYDKAWTLDKSIVKEIYTNNNNVEIVIVNGVSRLAEDEMGGPVEGSPGNGKIGALVNLNNSQFPGIAFEVDNTFGLENFKSILSTISVTKTQSNLQSIKLYFHNPKLDPNFENIVANDFKEVRIPKTQTPLRATIEELLKLFVSEDEKTYGSRVTSFKLKSAVIVNGTAKLTFDDPEYYTSGGSSRVNLIYSQIEKTALQFPSVKKVEITGATFQP